MTAFPWKILRNGQELVFPEGARRYVSVDVEQIAGDGGIDRAYDGSVIILGDPAFRRHAVSMSCSGHTVAPVFDLWPNQIVTLEAPVEFAVPGSSAVLSNDPVAGSVYGVDDMDNRVPATVSGRTVNAPGAVAIRFRPVLECVVVSRTASKTQGRADGGWNIRMEELSGFEETEDSGDRISFEHLPIREYAIGTPFSLSLAAQVSTNTGLPVSYTIVSGALPAGLSLNASTGVVSGTPTALGVFVVSVRASSALVSATQTFVFSDPIPTVSLAAAALQTPVRGTAFSLALGPLTTITDSAGPVSYSIVSGALPAGLSLNASTGLISGTPTNWGAFSVVVQAALATGQTARETYAFSIAAPTIALSAASLQSTLVGVAYSLNLAPLTSIANSTSAATYSVVSGSLPPGVSLNTSTGLISGAPTTDGAYAVTIQAALPTGQTAQETYAFQVATPMVFLAGADLQYFVVGTAFALDLALLTTVSNTTASPTYSVVSGALPDGMSLNASTGLISGTPTAFGAFAATIEATLPTGQAARETYAFYDAPTILPVLSTSEQDPFFYENGVPFSRVLNGLITVDGGPSTALDVSYALAPGSTLPPGLSLVSSGTPATFTVQGTPTGLHVEGQYVVVVIRATYEGATLDVPVFFADVSLDRDAVLSGGTEFDYTPFGSSGPNVPHRRYTFNASGTLTLLTSGWFTYLLVGGGGPGGNSNGTFGGAGGGAGGVRMERIWRPAGEYPVIVGAGGAPGGNGGTTSITGPDGFNRSIAGGTSGAGVSNGAANTTASASCGGSTGSAVRAVAADLRWGSSGGVGATNAAGNMAGGGGGHGSRGGDSAGVTHSGNGGGGFKIVFGSETLVLACGGGGGARNGGSPGVSGSVEQANGGNGGAVNTAGQAGAANTGNGGGGAGGFTSGTRTGGAGGSGVAIFWTRRPA